MSCKPLCGFQLRKGGGDSMETFKEVKLYGLTFSEENAQEVESLKAQGFTQVNNRRERSNLYMIFYKKE